MTSRIAITLGTLVRKRKKKKSLLKGQKKSEYVPVSRLAWWRKSGWTRYLPSTQKK